MKQGDRSGFLGQQIFMYKLIIIGIELGDVKSRTSLQADEV
jgi:hypothetical protein